MRMIEAGDDLRLALEPLTRQRVGRDVRGQDLDGDVAIQPRVGGLVDLAHPAGPERADHLVGSETRSRGQHHAVSLLLTFHFSLLTLTKCSPHSVFSLPAPAAGARILAGHDRAGAGHAADARIVLSCSGLYGTSCSRT